MGIYFLGDAEAQRAAYEAGGWPALIAEKNYEMAQAQRDAIASQNEFISSLPTSSLPAGFRTQDIPNPPTPPSPPPPTGSISVDAAGNVTWLLRDNGPGRVFVQWGTQPAQLWVSDSAGSTHVQPAPSFYAPGQTYTFTLLDSIGNQQAKVSYTVPSKTVSPAPKPVANGIYQFNDGSQTYSVQILQVGDGGPGLTMLDGTVFPIGSVYVDMVDMSKWQVSAAGKATQIVQAAGGGTGSGGAAGGGNKEVTQATSFFDSIPMLGWIVLAGGGLWLLRRA